MERKVELTSFKSGPEGVEATQRHIPVLGKNPVGSGGRPKYALFAGKTPAVDGLIAQFPQFLEPEVRPPLHEGAIWLVRADGYVACSSSKTEEIASYLDSLIQPGSR